MFVDIRKGKTKKKWWTKEIMDELENPIREWYTFDWWYTQAQWWEKLDMNDSTAVYDGYTYLNISQDEDNPEYVICIYYINASATIFNKYLIQLKNLGLLNDGVDSTENYLTAILTTVISDGTNDFQVTIKLMYQISSNTICLAVYEAAQK